MTEQILLIIVTAVVTSAGSAFATVVGLRVHIDYIRTALKDHADVHKELHKEHRDEFKRVHRRIDDVAEKIADKDCRFPSREHHA